MLPCANRADKAGWPAPAHHRLPALILCSVKNSKLNCTLLRAIVQTRRNSRMFLFCTTPLQRQISIRFETLLIRRLALEELARFIESRLHALLGERVAELLGEVIATRSEATTRALDALRLQYREYAEALEQRFLSQSGFRLALAVRPEGANHQWRRVPPG